MGCNSFDATKARFRRAVCATRAARLAGRVGLRFRGVFFAVFGFCVDEAALLPADAPVVAAGVAGGVLAWAASRPAAKSIESAAAAEQRRGMCTTAESRNGEDKSRIVPLYDGLDANAEAGVSAA